MRHDRKHACERCHQMSELRRCHETGGRYCQTCLGHVVKEHDTPLISIEDRARHFRFTAASSPKPKAVLPPERWDDLGDRAVAEIVRRATRRSLPDLVSLLSEFTHKEAEVDDGR